MKTTSTPNMNEELPAHLPTLTRHALLREGLDTRGKILKAIEGRPYYLIMLPHIGGVGQAAVYQWLGLPVPDRSPAHQQRLERARERVNMLTDEQRKELFSEYCVHCGSTDPGCQCWNDE